MIKILKDSIKAYRDFNKALKVCRKLHDPNRCNYLSAKVLICINQITHADLN